METSAGAFAASEAGKGHKVRMEVHIYYTCSTSLSRGLTPSSFHIDLTSEGGDKKTFDITNTHSQTDYEMSYRAMNPGKKKATSAKGSTSGKTSTPRTAGHPALRASPSMPGVPQAQARRSGRLLAMKQLEDINGVDKGEDA